MKLSKLTFTAIYASLSPYRLAAAARQPKQVNHSALKVRRFEKGTRIKFASLSLPDKDKETIINSCNEIA